MHLESKLYESFRRIKSDILRINDKLNKLSAAMEVYSKNAVSMRTQEDQNYVLDKINSVEKDVDRQKKIMEKMIDRQAEIFAKVNTMARIEGTISAKQKDLEFSVKNLKTSKKKKQVKIKKTKLKTPKIIVKRIKTVRHKSIFIASKSGKKFHYENCPFAKNIMPKSKKIFKSKTAALNSGYKACDCVKKI